MKLSPRALPIFADGGLALVAPDLLAARFTTRKRVLSDAAWNGGAREAAAVANHKMRADAFASAAAQELYCNALLARHGLPTETPIQLTAAPVSLAGCVQAVVAEARLTVCISAGVRTNAVWAGDPASFDESPEAEFTAAPGTINALIFVDARLADSVYPHIFTVVAEAKADLLRACGVRSCYSDRFATGTGTDSTVVVGDPLSRRGFTSASTHARLGMGIASGVRAALAEALAHDGFAIGEAHAAR